MIDWISNPIVSCTAVLSSKISSYVYNTPGTSNRQHFTVFTIPQHSGPGDIWGWFTSCITVQIQIRTLRNSLSIRRRSYSWWSWKERIWQCMALELFHYYINYNKLLHITFISKGGENNGSIYTLYCATVAVFLAVTMTSSSTLLH